MVKESEMFDMRDSLFTHTHTITCTCMTRGNFHL